MRLTIPPALVWRRSVLVNGRLVMELTSNLALRSWASATSGNDIDGMRTDDESARSDGGYVSSCCFPPCRLRAVLHRANSAVHGRQQAGSLIPGLMISPMIKDVMSFITRARMRASAGLCPHRPHTHTAPRRCISGRSSRVAKTLD